VPALSSPDMAGESATVPAWLLVVVLAIGAAAPIIAQWLQGLSARRARAEERLAARRDEQRADARELQDALVDLMTATPETHERVDEPDQLWAAKARLEKWAARVADQELRQLSLEVESRLKVDYEEATSYADWKQARAAFDCFNERLATFLHSP
jgi:hypothetical protein